MRTLVKALFVVVALIAFTALSIYAYLSVLDPGDFRDDIAKLVKSTTGRDLVMGGNVSFKFFPAPKLLVESVSLSNAEWGSRPTLVSVDRVIAELALVPLFSRTISIKSIVLIRPVLNLERNASGESNWNLWQSASPYTGSGALVIDVSNVDVRNGRISYLKHGAGRPSVLKVQNLKLRSKGLFQPLDLRFKGQFNKRAVTIRGETGSLASLFKNESFAVDVSINSGGIVAKIEGGLKQPLELRGLDAKLTLTARNFNRFINRDPHMSGEPLVFTGEGRIRDKKNRYVVDNLELAVGMNDLAGSLSFGSVKGRRLVRGTLSSKLMDVDSLFPKPKRKKRGPGGRVIPDWTIPVKSLRSLDLDINFTGRRVILRGMELGRLKMKVGLDSGRLQVKPRARLYAGKFDGRIELDAKAGTPRLFMEIRGTKVNMGALLSALKNKQVMAGARGQLYLKLEGVGLNSRAIAASMDGRFLTSVGSGQIHGAAIKRIGADALMQLVRTFDPSDNDSQVMSMQCGVIIFDVEKGIATSDRGIVAETKRTNVIGSGTISLRSEAIDLTLRAQPRDGVGLSAGALGNVVRVRGTLAEPVKNMDAFGALKTGASVGAAVATSGISLLVQGLFNRVIADNAPCKTALKVKPSARKIVPQSSSGITQDRNSR